MQITDVRIRKVEAEGKLKAYVTITFDDCFVVHNVKIIEGTSGLFIAMPSRKTANGEYKDVAHPISPDFRNAIQSKILDEYNAGHVEIGTGSSKTNCFFLVPELFEYFRPSSSGKTMAFGAIISLVRILPA